MNTNAFRFEYGDFVSGYVDVVDGEFIRSGACMTLVEALQTMFAKYDSCFLTLNGSTCAIIKQNYQFAVVDSHACSSAGMVDGDGFSVVVYYNSLRCVLRHIENLAACIGGNPKIFEISGISFPFKCQKTSDSYSKNINDKTQKKKVLFPTNNRPMGCPCKTVNIVGDGNCFFRAVAQVICGTQKPHRAVRLAIVKHMELHSVQYNNLLRCQYASMEDYLSRSKMRFVGSWDTEVEI